MHNNAVNESTNADIRGSKALVPGYFEQPLEIEIKQEEELSDANIQPSSQVSAANSTGFEETNTWLESLPQLFFVFLILVAVIYFAYDYDRMIELLEQFVDWVGNNPVRSSASIILVYIGLVIFTFPVMYLTVALGYTYTKAWMKKSQEYNAYMDQYHLNSAVVGFLGALMLIATGVMLGALSAFVIAKFWLGKTIKKRCLKNQRSFIAINQIVQQSGWKIVVLLRLTPLPFSIVSYFLGLTKVKIRDFIIGSQITTIYIAIWLYIGKSLQKFTSLNEKLKQQKTQNPELQSSNDAQFEFLFIAFEIIMAFGAGIFISYKAKIELDKQVEQCRIRDEEQQRVLSNSNQ